MTTAATKQEKYSSPLDGGPDTLGRKEGRKEGAIVTVELFDNTFLSILAHQVESAGLGKSLLQRKELG